MEVLKHREAVAFGALLRDLYSARNPQSFVTRLFSGFRRFVPSEIMGWNKYDGRGGPVDYIEDPPGATPVCGVALLNLHRHELRSSVTTRKRTVAPRLRFPIS